MPKSYGYKPSGGTGGNVENKDELPRLSRTVVEHHEQKPEPSPRPSQPASEKAAPATKRPRQHSPKKEQPVASLRVREAGSQGVKRTPEEISRAVGSVLSVVLDGQTLPLDVARTLVNPELQSEVIGRVQTSAYAMHEQGEKVDLMAIGDTLTRLDEMVLDTIRNVAGSRS